jgi:hypothetical protein
MSFSSKQSVDFLVVMTVLAGGCCGDERHDAAAVRGERRIGILN